MTNLTLKDKVIVITGGSRGIGEAIALRCAKEGAKIAICAKTATPSDNPILTGTIHTVSEAIEAEGGTALPLQVDVRDENQIINAIEKIVSQFGKIDILINNASAIFLASTLEIPIKKFDLMFAVNVRATFATSQACLPHLIKAENPHILNLSPPLNLNKKWFKNNLAYTMSKYGMSMCTLGLAEEFKSHGIAVNSLWPRTPIATAAITANFPPQIYEASRKAEIVAEAAYTILTQDSRASTGNFFIDEDVLRSVGVKDFKSYAINPDKPLMKDFYLD